MSFDDYGDISDHEEDYDSNGEDAYSQGDYDDGHGPAAEDEARRPMVISGGRDGRLTLTEKLALLNEFGIGNAFYADGSSAVDGELSLGESMHFEFKHAHGLRPTRNYSLTKLRDGVTPGYVVMRNTDELVSEFAADLRSYMPTPDGGGGGGGGGPEPSERAPFTSIWGDDLPHNYGFAEPDKDAEAEMFDLQADDDLTPELELDHGVAPGGGADDGYGERLELGHGYAPVGIEVFHSSGASPDLNHTGQTLRAYRLASGTEAPQSGAASDVDAINQAAFSRVHSYDHSVTAYTGRDLAIAVYAVALESGAAAWVSASLTDVTDSQYRAWATAEVEGGYAPATRHLLYFAGGRSSDDAAIDVLVLGGGYLFCIGSNRLVTYRLDGPRLTMGGHRVV